MTFSRCIRCNATFHSTQAHLHQCDQESTDA